MTENGQTAAVNPGVFRQLDALLQQLLDAGNDAIDLDALTGLISRNPIEVGPLQALGATGDAADLQQRLTILRRVYPALQRCKNSLRIEASLLPETFSIYIPVARYMARRAEAVRQQQQRAVVFGINGGQGSGKTTVNTLLQIVLRDGLGKKAAGFSIDDVYKPYEQRQAMAQRVHPLFAIRSVAGTHDTDLATVTLNRLMHAQAGEQVAVPCFDKRAKGGQGDRLPESAWPRVEGPVDIVIFDGWCVGALPQRLDTLSTPINEREATEDPDAVWRNAVNRQLANEYRDLFNLIDELMVIQVRSMDDVFRNRELQEQHLRRQLEEARQRGEDTGDLGAMTPQEVIDFISLFERTTRHMLKTLPSQARLTLFIGDRHAIERVRVNGNPAPVRLQGFA